MKKGIAIALVIVGTLGGVYGLAWANLMLFLTLYVPVGLILAFAATVAAAFGLDALRRLFKRHYGLSVPIFLLFTYLPPVFCAVIMWIVFFIALDLGYFSGLFAGLSEFLTVLSYSINAGVLLVFGMIWLAIFTAVEKRYREK